MDCMDPLRRRHRTVTSRAPALGPAELTSRPKQILKRLGMGVGGLVVLYLLLMALSWLLVEPKDDVAFFESRRGEHHPLVFAHQGGDALRPENTMIAFRASLVVGADVIDTDMNVTRDGVLVLLHDETVDRTSDGSGKNWRPHLVGVA